MMKTSHCRHSETGGRLSRGGVSMDTLGIIASGLCMVHCVTLPLVLLVVPTFAAQVLSCDCTHLLLAGAVTAFCLLAIVPGYLRHRNKGVLALMLVGLSLVLFATFGVHSINEALEMPVISFGNILVVLAHLRNRRLSHVHSV